MQSPGRQFLIDTPGEPPRKRIVLVRHAATASSEETHLHRGMDEPCSSLGEVQAVKVAEFLMDAAIENLFVSPAERAVFTAAAIAKCQSLTGNRAPRLQVVEELRNIEVGSYSGRLASEVRRLCHQQPHRAGRCSLLCTVVSRVHRRLAQLRLVRDKDSCQLCKAGGAGLWRLFAGGKTTHSAAVANCLAALLLGTPPPQAKQPPRLAWQSWSVSHMQLQCKSSRC